MSSIYLDTRIFFFFFFLFKRHGEYRKQILNSENKKIKIVGLIVKDCKCLLAHIVAHCFIWKNMCFKF